MPKRPRGSSCERARAWTLGAVLLAAACGSSQSPSESETAGVAIEPVELRQVVVADDAAALDGLLERGLQLAAALQVASEEGRPGLLRLLLDRGADPGSEYASRALFAALTAERLASARVLEAAGATLDAVDEAGMTLVHQAAVRGKTADVRRLLELGADPRRATTTGVTALMDASGAGRARAVELLLRAGAMADERDRDGWTALFYAAREGEDEVVRLLLAAGATPGPVSDLGWTPLLLACRRGSATVVRSLLAAGASIEGGTRRDALVLAVRSGRPEVVSELLAAGAPGGAGERPGDPAWWARRLGKREISRLLEAAP